MPDETDALRVNLFPPLQELDPGERVVRRIPGRGFGEVPCRTAHAAVIESQDSDPLAGKVIRQDHKRAVEIDFLVTVVRPGAGEEHHCRERALSRGDGQRPGRGDSRLTVFIRHFLLDVRVRLLRGLGAVGLGDRVDPLHHERRSTVLYKVSSDSIPVRLELGFIYEDGFQFQAQAVAGNGYRAPGDIHDSLVNAVYDRGVAALFSFRYLERDPELHTGNAYGSQPFSGDILGCRRAFGNSPADAQHGSPPGNRCNRKCRRFSHFSCSF